MTNDFGRRMKDARMNRGLTMMDLCMKSGVSVYNIARYESGNSDPTMKNLVKLAKALGMTIDQFIGKEVQK